MNQLNQNQNLNEIKNETWTWNGKQVKLGFMNIGQLEQCLNFIKKDLKGSKTNHMEVFGKPRYYWLNVLSIMIKYKSDDNVNYIVKQMNAHRIRVVTEKINKLTVNKTTLI